MMKILVSDKLAEEGLKILKDVKEFGVDCKYDLTPDQLKSKIKNYDALIIRSGTTVTEDVIASADKLKFIGRAGVGLDNVDLKAATKKGIVAMNTPGGNTTSTAEHTMSLLLSLSRSVPQAYMSMKEKRWDRSKFKGAELYGKTLGIVGLGRIGSTVARMAKGFSMQIIAFDPFLSKEVAEKVGVDVVELDELLKKSDYITIHIPKSADTQNLISTKEFKKMKKTARLINCARGGIVDEKALIEALKSGEIAGAALDVYDAEPPEFSSELFKLDNLITTPHLGASTSEAQVNVAIEIAETVRDALLGKGIKNAANFPSVSAEAFKVLQPFIDLAQRMGKFAGQLINGRMTEIKVSYSGVMTRHKVAPITISLVNGLLKPILGETVNAINACDVARERGINVQEIQTNTEEEYVNRISVDVVTDKEMFSLWGTLSNHLQPRIVKVNSVYVEAVPDGNILYIHNNDQPGIVGLVGSVLGKNGINIASITFGRDKQGGMATSVVNVDNPVPDNIIEELKKDKNIRFVKLIQV